MGQKSRNGWVNSAETDINNSQHPERLYYGFEKLANKHCTREFDRYLSKYPEVAHRLFSSNDFDLLRDTIYNRSARINDTDFEVYVKLAASLRNATGIQCEKKVLEACRDKELLDKIENAAKEKNQAYQTDVASQKKSQMDSEAQEEEGRRYVASGDQSIDYACAAIVAIKTDEQAIAHEKSIGRASGTVNLTALNQLGRRLEGTKMVLQGLKPEILKMSGKPFSPEICRGRKSRHYSGD